MQRPDAGFIKALAAAGYDVSRMTSYEDGHTAPTFAEWCKGLPDAAWQTIFEAHYRMPYVNLRQELRRLRVTDETLIRRLFAHDVLPLYQQEDQAVCAVTSRLAPDMTDDLKTYFKADIVEKMADVCLIRDAWMQQLAPPQATEVETTRTFDLRRSSTSTPDKVLGLLLEKALILEASDVHCYPQGELYHIEMRVDGDMQHMVSLSRGYAEPLTNRIKILSEMDISERRRPQDGHFILHSDQGVCDVRVSTLTPLDGEKVVLRLLPQAGNGRFQSLASLGMSAVHRSLMEKMLAAPSGLLLVVGPTNSGKSTTLYLMMRLLSAHPRVLYSIEDPVEMVLPQVHQVQVNEKSGLDFALGLRGILRQDPDVILIGEIRDRETATIACRAALTGHLVLASLHATTAQEAIERLRDLDVQDALLSGVLLGVLGQRLHKKQCQVCGGTGQSMMAGPCEVCRDSGLQGRMGLFECWLPTERARRAVRNGMDGIALRHLAITDGFVTLDEDRKQKLEDGLLYTPSM